ncbi:hypothetical protein MBANPS3_006098 [Mucor bainieri]
MTPALSAFISSLDMEISSPCMSQGETVSTHNDAIAPPSNGQCIVLESERIRPLANSSSSSNNEQHARDQMVVNLAALDSHDSHTAAWPNSFTHVHIEPISGCSAIAPTSRSLDLSLTRQISTHMSNGMPRISTSMQRMASHLAPTTTTSNTASLSTLSRMPSAAMSLPPAYKLYSDNDTSDQQLRQKMAELARLEAFYRSNPGAVIYELMWGDPVDGEKRVTWKDMCNTCFLLQFTGVYMVFWILVLGLAGCLSLFVLKLPGPLLLLWVPILLFLVGVYVAHKRYRKQLQELEELEEYVEAARERRVEEIVQRRNRHNDHFFVIRNLDDHTHAVVTLLPPPPVYVPAEKMSTAIMTSSSSNSA